MSYLGIEIGGTKLQLGIGRDDGVLQAIWRGTVDLAAGADGIRRQILNAVPQLLTQAGQSPNSLRGVGIGFGGPVDDLSQRVICSHHVQGWDDYPLIDWIKAELGLPAVLGNDADVAGLGEAIHGAGKDRSPMFYITLGSGIGGGLILDGDIYRGVGRGAAEIGHLRMRGTDGSTQPLESLASGWGIARSGAILAASKYLGRTRLSADLNHPSATTEVAKAAQEGDVCAQQALEIAIDNLAEGICHVIAILCPRRIVIGGGVSLLGDQLFRPLQVAVEQRVFRPFMGLTDIVPAALGESVVLHGAIALAHRRLN